MLCLLMRRRAGGRPVNRHNSPQQAKHVKYTQAQKFSNVLQQCTDVQTSVNYPHKTYTAEKVSNHFYNNAQMFKPQ